VVDLTSEEVMAGNLSEAAVACTEETRDQYLYYVLNRHPGQTIVFCNAISALRRVVALMKLLGIPAAALHANMQQRQRLKALDRFTSVRTTAHPRARPESTPSSTPPWTWRAE
jgi:ATP-dependent RNA helicase DDX24/MAK5